MKISHHQRAHKSQRWLFGRIDRCIKGGGAYYRRSAFPAVRDAKPPCIHPARVNGRSTARDRAGMATQFPAARSTGRMAASLEEIGGRRSVVSVMSGFLAALIAGENKRAPLVLGFLLLAFGLLKLVLSWPYVPIWYHVIFTALLIPMTMMGGKLKTTT
jgi:hypothetical protein